MHLEVRPAAILIIEMALADLHQKWQQDYPGESNAVVALRDNLARAEHHRDHIRTVFENLALDLSETHLPMHHWDRRTQRHYLYFEKLQSRTQREFIKALKLLHDFCATVQTKATALAKREPTQPPEIIYNQKAACWVQLAEIQTIDGKVVTKLDYDARYWLTAQTLDIAKEYQRHFYFPDAIIPAPYAWVLSDNGITYPPTEAVFITYSPEEFMRLCQLELDTNSEYLLDGHRLTYERLR